MCLTVSPERRRLLFPYPMAAAEIFCRASPSKSGLSRLRSTDLKRPLSLLKNQCNLLAIVNFFYPGSYPKNPPLTLTLTHKRRGDTSDFPSLDGRGIRGGCMVIWCPFVSCWRLMIDPEKPPLLSPLPQGERGHFRLTDSPLTKGGRGLLKKNYGLAGMNAQCDKFFSYEQTPNQSSKYFPGIKIKYSIC
jgi:hypothetical protein